MKYVLLDDSPGRLRLLVSRSPKVRLAGTVAGLVLVSCGLFLMLYTPNRSEFLRITREEGHLECTAGRMLPGGETAEESSLLTEKPVRAAMEGIRASGGKQYRLLLQTEDENFSFGKGDYTLQEATEIVARINTFLDGGDGSTFAYREDGGWPGAPAGVAGLASGFFLLAFVHRRVVWIFDRSRDALVRELHFFLCIHHWRRPLSTLRSASVAETAGSNASHSLRLRLENGRTLDLVRVPWNPAPPMELARCAERITAFVLERSVHMDSLPTYPSQG